MTYELFIVTYTIVYYSIVLFIAVVVVDFSYDCYYDMLIIINK